MRDESEGQPLDGLGFDPLSVAGWFAHELRGSYSLVSVPDEIARDWSHALSMPIRRCYVSDEVLKEWAAKRGVTASAVLAAHLPDPGSVMSGDFAEILVFIYQATLPELKNAVAPRKWRLKGDRTKPAPYSDVVYFLLPSWPTASVGDTLICSEVKAKASASKASPVLDAVRDSAKDRVSRLARTLVWLRERALTMDVDNLTLPILDRFLDAAEQPPFGRKFNAVAVISKDLLDGELSDVPTEASAECDLTIIAVPQLREVYARAYNAVLQSAVAPDVQ